MKRNLQKRGTMTRNKRRKSKKEKIPVVICGLPFCRKYISKIEQEWKKNYIIN